MKYKEFNFLRESVSLLSPHTTSSLVSDTFDPFGNLHKKFHHHQETKPLEN